LATVSIVIPAYNEAAGIGALLAYLRQVTADEPDLEIIVADGGSTDGTRARARRAGATVVRSPRKGRAAQLNYGARQATGDILYFLHADSYPPPGFLADLRRAQRQGYGSGCYRLASTTGTGCCALVPGARACRCCWSASATRACSCGARYLRGWGAFARTCW
jgi:glycosyltransferase involved in cell wall biosynthesis